MPADAGRISQPRAMAWFCRSFEPPPDGTVGLVVPVTGTVVTGGVDVVAGGVGLAEKPPGAPPPGVEGDGATTSLEKGEVLPSGSVAVEDTTFSPGGRP